MPLIERRIKVEKHSISSNIPESVYRDLVLYAEFVEDDIGYVITQALEKVFGKDKEFAEWKAMRQERPKVKAIA